MGAVEKSLNKFGKESAFLQRASRGKESVKGEAEDPFPKSQQVGSAFWSIPLFFTIILTCVILGLQFVSYPFYYLYFAFSLTFM
jgi:hypothetical protein